MRIVTVQPLRENQKVVVRVGLGEEVRGVTAQVVWVRDISDGYAVGLRFDGSDELDADFLIAVRETL